MKKYCRGLILCCLPLSAMQQEKGKEKDFSFEKNYSRELKPVSVSDIEQGSGTEDIDLWMREIVDYRFTGAEISEEQKIHIVANLTNQLYGSLNNDLNAVLPIPQVSEIDFEEGYTSDEFDEYWENKRRRELQACLIAVCSIGGCALLQGLVVLIVFLTH